MNRIFVGFDDRQVVAYTVAQQSIINHSSKPISITPLVIDKLPINRVGLTAFTYSRFLVPWLCEFEGTALFVDADVLFRADPIELFEYNGSAVSVVPHEKKFERPSVMLFDCKQCTKLTPEYVQSSDKLFDLASWADTIGILPMEWNHLVGYDQPDPNAKLVHFTQGIPCFEETKNDEHKDEWMATARQVVSSVSWAEMMGKSVHVQSVKQRQEN